MQLRFGALVALALTLAPNLAYAAPDLVVSSLTVSPSSPPAGSGTINIVFENIGPDDVDLPFTEFTNYTVALDGAMCDSGFIADLAAGDTNAESTTSCNPATPGPHMITVTIDSDFDVTEANESNNVRTATFVWTGPDLVVSSLSVSPSSPAAGSGTIDIEFQNVGPTGVSLPVTEFTNYTVALDGTMCDSGFIADLAAGDTNAESSTSCNPVMPGSHTITVTIDSDGDVAEQDETNNSRTETFVWTGPDLVVASITLTPTTPMVGDGTISILFENSGPTDVDLPLTEFTNYTVALDGTLCASGFFGDLAAAATHEETTTACNASTAGLHTITVTVDSDGDVSEQDETNNVRMATFSWLMPGAMACTGAGDCTSGNCVDGVCCDTACGGGADDCQACSVSAGAETDGTCGALRADFASTVVCRPASGMCDRAESCSSASTECPADAPAPDGTGCGDGAACNGAEVCSGGACVSGTAPSCDDSNACTADMCVDPGGCQNTPIPGCDDGGVLADGGVSDDASVGDASTMGGPTAPGCTCRVSTSRPPRHGLLLVALGLGVWVYRRRRRA